jgi:hypothetical protein
LVSWYLKKSTNYRGWDYQLPTTKNKNTVVYSPAKPLNVRTF